MATKEGSTSPRPGVAPLWRTLALTLLAAVAADALLDVVHRRTEFADPAPAVYEVGPPDRRLSDRVLDAVDFDHVRVDDALAALGRQANLKVVTDWAPDDAALAGTTISLHLRHASFATMIDAISNQAGPTFTDRPLAWWQGHDGVVRVATQPRLESEARNVVVRVYDVRPELAQLAGPPPVPPQGKGPISAYDPYLDHRADDLRKLVMDTVAPASWKDNGGEVGSLEMWGGLMVVTQSEYNQWRLESFLLALRERRR